MTELFQSAAADPSGIALRDERLELTWAEVHERVTRATNAMLALPLGPDRRIAVFAENSAEVLLCHVAALFAGVSTVPVNFHLKGPEAAHILTDSQASAVFVGPETAEVGLEAARIAGIATVIGWRCPAEVRLASWSDWLDSATSDVLTDDRQPRPSLLYTSGTTGRPKGVEVPPHVFLGGRTVGEHLAKMNTKPLARYGTHLVVGPLYHTAPLSSFRLLAVGTPVVVMGRFDPENTLAAIERWKVESSIMVPTHFVRLLQLPKEVRYRYDLSSLKMVTHTGSSCPVEVKGAMIDWWGPIFLDAYGATEVGATCQISSIEWLEHPGSVGRPIPPFTALILDEEGRELPANTEGRLYFVDGTGRGIVYHGSVDRATEVHLAPGVFTLGEIGYVDDEGYVYITDRFSDMVVSGGVNVYPAESERVLIQHPDVADVAVIGVPHPVMGEELKALVVPVDPAALPDESSLLDYCRARLSHYKCPRSIDFVATLGRSAMGKLNKASLRAAYRSSSAGMTG